MQQKLAAELFARLDFSLPFVGAQLNRKITQRMLDLHAEGRPIFAVVVEMPYAFENGFLVSNGQFNRYRSLVEFSKF